MGVSWALFKVSFVRSWKRFALVAGSVALGVYMLLAFTAVFNAASNTQRSEWRLAISDAVRAQSNSKMSVQRDVDPVYVEAGIGHNLNKWRDREVTSIYMAASGERSPGFFGLRIPSAGEYYVSPALAEIMQSHPEDNLAARYGDKQIGLLPDRMLAHPDELIVIRNGNLEELKRFGAVPMYSFDRQQQDPRELVINSVMYLGIFIMLFPVVLLVSIAAQLGSVQREQRYAALRLVGATKGQITNIIATESLIAAASGIALGFSVYALTRPYISNISLNETRYWLNDITVLPWQMGMIVLGTLAVVLFANWWGMRHVHTSPLGVVRRQKNTRTPHMWRVLPLVIAIGLMVYLRFSVEKDQASATIVISVAGTLVLMMIGLVLAGPWLTSTIARIAAKSAKRPTTLIGTRYIAMHAGKISRSVIGVVVALFAGSFYLTAVSGVDDLQRSLATNSGQARLQSQTALVTGGELEKTLSEPGYVEKVSVIESIAGASSLMPCEIAHEFLIKVTCPAGSNWVAVNFHGTSNGKSVVFGEDKANVVQQLGGSPTSESASAHTPEYLIKTSGEHTDALRSILLSSTPDMFAARQVMLTSGTYAQKQYIDPAISKLAALAYGGIALTMLVATASLTVSTVGGLMERRRSLFTLRLGGMQVRELKQMVLIESLIPLVATSILAAGLGVATGYLFMQMVSRSLDAQLSPVYFVVVLGSITFAVLAIYMILPLIQKITEPTANQTE